MNYIVFDLEWNQSPDGKKGSNSRLPFEIIEIGAVKMNEDKEILDTFQRLIKPEVYKWIHNSIHEVIHMDYKDLSNGVPFPQAVREFFDWCGPDKNFFTWGNQDVMELQRNLKYYEMLYMLPGPIHYYDVQKLYSIQYEDGISRRSLEHAVDALDVNKDHGFHRALDDALYTAEIFKEISMDCAFKNASLDVYQNPKSKKEEIYISYPEYDKFVSREFISRDRVMRDKEVASTRCPICRCLAKRRVRWFMNNSKVYYSVSDCKEHGYIVGKVRIRKTEDDKYFAIKKLKPATEEEAAEIREKRDLHHQKKQLKRNLEKEI